MTISKFISLFFLLYLTPQLTQARNLAAPFTSFTSTYGEYDILRDAFDPSPEQETLLLTKIDSSRVYDVMDAKKALQFAGEAMVLAYQLDRADLYVKIFNQFGRIYFNAGLVEPSLEYYLKSLNLSTKSSKIPIYDKLLTHLGVGANYLFLEEYEKAENYFSIARELLDKLPEMDYRLLAIISNNLGIIYTAKEDFLSAYDVLDKAIKTMESIDPNNQVISLLYNNLGKVFIDLKNFEEAEKVFTEAITFNQRTQNTVGLTNNYQHLTELYLKRDNFKTAISFGRMGLNLAHKLGILPIEHNCSQYLADLYKKVGQSDSALYFLERVEDLANMINANGAKKMALMEEMKSSWKQEKENLMKAENKTNQKLYLLLLLIAVIVIFLLILLFIIRRRYKAVSLESMSLKLQAEQLNLESKMLQGRLEEKKQELDNLLVYESNKNTILTETVDKLIKHKNEFDKQGAEIVKHVLRDLNKLEKDKILAEFEVSFLELHLGFYENLLREFPDLSHNERRLCAFLRINLNNKEIASLTGQTIASLQIAKNRLRKKLGITHPDEDIMLFLSRF